MKNNYLKFIILLLFICLSFEYNTQAQSINTNALDAYWKLTDKLRLGDTLSRDDWKKFLALDGNKQYIANQGFDNDFLERYRKWMQMVYMPKYDAQLIKMMQHPFDYWIAYKINQYKAHEIDLRKYESSLHNAAYLDSMYKNAWVWLPKRLQGKSTRTKLFFIGIDNDAIVNGDTIVFTTWSAYNQDKLKYGSLGGHELHHVLRQPVGFNSVKTYDEGIVSILSQVLNEGSADMVDKKLTFDTTKKDIPLEYHYDDILLSHTDTIIRQIDSAIMATATSKGQQFTTARQYRKLTNYSSGHNPGYHMADIIVRNGYKNELIEHIQSPFYFVFLYNKAAKKDKQHPPVFSTITINYLKQLEKLYWVKPKP
ncbi:MAG: DUF5700 domain-containing putative Zn-dependent protease [Bacteroidota bacterium]